MANESVLFKRGDSATITSTPVTDGQILFDTSGNGKMYLDNGTDRLEMGGAVTVDASLSKTSTNAVQNKAVTGNILNSLTEVDAATQQNTIAGALALKEANSVLKETNSNLGGCSFEQEGDNFYVVGADAVRKKLGSSGIGGTLETVAVRDRTVMTRNYIFNNTGDYVSLVLNVKTPPNGGNANSVTVYGTAIGTSTYKQIQKITTLNADVTVNIKGYDHIKLAVTASHSGNGGHSYEATTITTYALS